MNLPMQAWLPFTHPVSHPACHCWPTASAWAGWVALKQEDQKQTLMNAKIELEEVDAVLQWKLQLSKSNFFNDL